MSDVKNALGVPIDKPVLTKEP